MGTCVLNWPPSPEKIESQLLKSTWPYEDKYHIRIIMSTVLPPMELIHPENDGNRFIFTLRFTIGRLYLSAFLTTVERSCKWEDRNARKVDNSPAALACWKHWKSARMSPENGMFRATKCSWKKGENKQHWRKTPTTWRPRALKDPGCLRAEDTVHHRSFHSSWSLYENYSHRRTIPRARKSWFPKQSVLVVGTAMLCKISFLDEKAKLNPVWTKWIISQIWTQIWYEGICLGSMDIPSSVPSSGFQLTLVLGPEMLYLVAVSFFHFLSRTGADHMRAEELHGLERKRTWYLTDCWDKTF